MYKRSLPTLLILFLSLFSIRAEANPMCKAGKARILKNSTQTVRSYKGELCKILPVAFWVKANCQEEPTFKNSSCDVNADAAIKGITQIQKDLYSTTTVSRIQNTYIDSPQGISSFIEREKQYKLFSSQDIKIWNRYKSLFPKPNLISFRNQQSKNWYSKRPAHNDYDFNDDEQSNENTSSHEMSVEEAFRTMELPSTATAAEVQKKYKMMTLKAHPDRGGNKEDFQKLNEANNVLKNYFAR